MARIFVVVVQCNIWKIKLGIGGCGGSKEKKNLVLVIVPILV